MRHRARRLRRQRRNERRLWEWLVRVLLRFTPGAVCFRDRLSYTTLVVGSFRGRPVRRVVSDKQLYEMGARYR